ncbi:MAG: hypothetical protein A2928_03515 [Candidatus Taylorbacteria bacterium RIFCSPLOWO2_01_FULL_45_15b]|uniref:Uncharacterized protein n=1 Tax=Candidatus Taylorbacteria bacterium RIFCSPLOWO2_01_FULL_45_15b TaxID=1802319 RepID=A0A1G2N915_9BACT|nr:MAG: hypothetical protein A2928_03515 [Candidatus Taylorbacteria bacterium RIFCSPLOWO2_01_FULL_45_15b]
MKKKVKRRSPIPKDLPESHKKVIRAVRRMSAKRGFKDLIKSGIYLPDGSLAPEYGGPPRVK